MIREAIINYLTNGRPQRRSDPILYVSDLGSHPAKVMRRVLTGEMAEFDPDIRIKMQSGNALEDDTLRAVQFAYSGVISQFPLYDEHWSGLADFVIGHGSDDVTIVEHKAMGDKWFDYKRSLPRSSHVAQLWLYGQLYTQLFGVVPQMRLYYRAWGDWAEFEIPAVVPDNLVRVSGRINGQDESRTLYIALPALRLELEQYHTQGTIPEDLPEDESSWNYAEDAAERLLSLWRAA